MIVSHSSLLFLCVQLQEPIPSSPCLLQKPQEGRLQKGSAQGTVALPFLPPAVLCPKMYSTQPVPPWAFLLVQSSTLKGQAHPSRHEQSPSSAESRAQVLLEDQTGVSFCIILASFGNIMSTDGRSNAQFPPPASGTLLLRHVPRNGLQGGRPVEEVWVPPFSLIWLSHAPIVCCVAFPNRSHQ